jgi:hypothetical protein
MTSNGGQHTTNAPRSRANFTPDPFIGIILAGNLSPQFELLKNSTDFYSFELKTAK